jgi:hypothetical protein
LPGASRGVGLSAPFMDGSAADIEEAPAFSAVDGEIVCTCGISGSTDTEPWDGTSAAAEAFAKLAGESTAALVARAPKSRHYAWLYASR